MLTRSFHPSLSFFTILCVYALLCFQGVRLHAGKIAPEPDTNKTSKVVTQSKPEVAPPLPPVIDTKGVRVSAPNMELSDRRHIQLNLDSVRMTVRLHEDDRDSSEFVITNVQARIKNTDLKGCTPGVLSVQRNGKTWTVVVALEFEKAYESGAVGNLGSVEIELSACTKSKKTNRTSIPATAWINFII